jgi:hypothetical protein
MAEDLVATAEDLAVTVGSGVVTAATTAVMASLVATGGTVDMAVTAMAAMASIRVMAMPGTATRIMAVTPIVAMATVISCADGSWDEMAACSFAELRYAIK